MRRIFLKNQSNRGRHSRGCIALFTSGIFVKNTDPPVIENTFEQKQYKPHPRLFVSLNALGCVESPNGKLDRTDPSFPSAISTGM
jgi:hypothetical protein